MAHFVPFIHAPHLLLLTSNLCTNKTHAVLLYGGSTLMGILENKFYLPAKYHATQRRYLFVYPTNLTTPLNFAYEQNHYTKRPHQICLQRNIV